MSLTVECQCTDKYTLFLRYNIEGNVESPKIEQIFFNIELIHLLCVCE